MRWMSSGGRAVKQSRDDADIACAVVMYSLELSLPVWCGAE